MTDEFHQQMTQGFASADDGRCGLRLCRQKDLGRAYRGGAATPARSAKHPKRQQAAERANKNSEYNDCMTAKQKAVRAGMHQSHEQQMHQHIRNQPLRAVRAGCREAGSSRIPLPAEQHPCPASNPQLATCGPLSMMTEQHPCPPAPEMKIGWKQTATSQFTP